MRFVLSVHCSGFSWRDMHKFASIYDMPSPLEHMQLAYLNKIEATINRAVKESIQPTADELDERVDSEPLPVADCINTAVSFDSCWKTRGVYSNVGFGSAISAINKNVLDFVLFNRTCELRSRWPAERQEQHREDYDKWYITHKANCRKNFSGSSQSMEPEAAKIIWGRSTEERKQCYTTFIGDAGAKSYSQVSAMNPYGSLQIHKEECLAHVSKHSRRDYVQ